MMCKGCFRIMGGVIVTVSLSLLVTVAFAASDVVVTAGLEKREVFVGEEIPLTITITGDFGNVPRPRLPQFDGFSWYYMQQSSRVKYDADRKGYHKILDFTFVFIPQRPGVFTVGPFDVPVEETVYKAPSIEVTVRGGSVPTQSSPQTRVPNSSPIRQSSVGASSAPQSSQGQNNQFPSSMMPSKHVRGADSHLFLKCWADNGEVYPGEQVNITYSLFTRLDTRYEGFRDEPLTKGFWVEDLTQPNKVEQQNVTFQGKRYLRADIRKLALFATTPGEYVIEPGVIRCSVAQLEQQPQSDYFGSFFQDQFFSNTMVQKRESRELGAEPFSVTVKPFPEKNKPEKFNNMVGAYVLNATVDKKRVKTNQPITVEVTVQGRGNIGTIERPYISLPEGVRVVEGQSTSHTVSSAAVVGWKKYEYMIIPDTAGAYTIGPFYSVYFNPDSEQYAVAESEAFRITVEQGEDSVNDMNAYLSTPVSDSLKKDVSRIDYAIRYIDDNEDSRAYIKIIHDMSTVLIRLNGVLVLCIIIAYFVRRAQFRLDNNVALRRYKRALRVFQRDIAKVAKKASSKKTEVLAQCFSEASRVLMAYFSDKCNLPHHAVTYDQLEESLAALSVGNEFCAEIKTFFADCDFARFAPSELSKEKTRLCVARCKSIVGRFEKHVLQSRKTQS